MILDEKMAKELFPSQPFRKSAKLLKQVAGTSFLCNNGGIFEKEEKMNKEIIPERQTVRDCLKDKTYHIDFYQREYVWSKNTVEVLLDDIFEVFLQSYLLIKNSELTEKIMAEKFSWYYMNVFITNKIGDKTYIVDGQQRLSTLTLICAKLYHLTSDNDLKELLHPCICGKKWKNNEYRIDHDKRKNVMDHILKGTKPDSYQNPTEKTLIERYKDISEYIDKKNLDEKQLEAFIYYFLNKLVLVELSINDQDDTAMVFEVINDRGEALKPFEILKGKLIGALDKSDTEAYSEKWDNAMQNVIGEEDQFFINYLKSRFVFKKNSTKENQINNSYHRYVFNDKDDAQELGFRKVDNNRTQAIKKFIDEDVIYYSKLYSKIRKSQNKFLRYNKEIHNLDGQCQLILSACTINDPQEDNKMVSIAKEYDRLHMLLRMNGVYDSNSFHEISYGLNEKIKNLPISNYRSVFDNIIIEKIREEKNLINNPSLLDYNSFSQIGYKQNIEKTALYYLLARVEDYICEEIKQEPQKDVFFMSTKHGKDGYQIEHIFSDNEESRKTFDTEEDFWHERNGIGALLLLKGRTNESSQNEVYEKKLQTYSHGTVWAQTLCKDFYNSHPDFADLKSRIKLKSGNEFKHYDSFTKQSMEERCRLLYDIVKIIWEVE